MKINCHTNLDLYPCERWPEALPCRPMVGDRITSSTGLELEVCAIRFSTRKPKELQSWITQGEKCVTMEDIKDCVICSVELHLPKRWENITEFEKWYKKRTL